jgi:hypothetical protein
MASIIEQSSTDRMKSKRVAKTLKDTANTPSTNNHRQYWYDLFQCFAKETLQINAREKCVLHALRLSTEQLILIILQPNAER